MSALHERAWDRLDQTLAAIEAKRHGMRFDEMGYPDYPACPTCGRNPGLERCPDIAECHPEWRPGIGQCCCGCDCEQGACWDMPGDWVGNAREDRVYMCDPCASDFMLEVA